MPSRRPPLRSVLRLGVCARASRVWEIRCAPTLTERHAALPFEIESQRRRHTSATIAPACRVARRDGGTLLSTEKTGAVRWSARVSCRAAASSPRGHLPRLGHLPRGIYSGAGVVTFTNLSMVTTRGSSEAARKRRHRSNLKLARAGPKIPCSILAARPVGGSSRAEAERPRCARTGPIADALSTGRTLIHRGQLGVMVCEPDNYVFP